MRCPYCHENIRVQGRFCAKCGEQIFGLQVRRRPGADRSAPDAAAPPTPSRTSGEVINIELEETAESTAAEAEAVGKTCPYCRFPIKKGEAVTICSECEVPHHTECWQDNGGCTTYGCRGAPQADRVRATYTAPRGAFRPSMSGALPVGAREILAAELDGQATNVLILAVLQIIFCLGILSIISLSWGLSIISQINKLGIGRAPARSKAIGAIVISGAVMLLWLLWGLAMLGAAQ